MNFSFVHEFDTDVASYWKLFLADDFNEDLYRELKVQNREVLEKTDDGKIMKRVQKMVPSTPLPGFLAAIVKDIGYTEFDTLDWAKNEMKIVIQPAAMKDRFDMHGLYTVAALGTNRCRREFKGEVKVSMPIVGGKIEKYMMEQLRDAYEVTSQITRKWIEKRKAS